MRKAALCLLALVWAAAAQFEEIDAEMLQCQEDCCTVAGGAWNANMQECDAPAGSAVSYQSCANACADAASRKLQGYTGGSGCCAPGFVLAAIICVSILRDAQDKEK